ncbi:phosphoribosyltransferase [Rhodocista pekingensis]|uniref:Phosphoribosyltransferase n=1 Tax=Rhodocista pekingensis TaxID=201185 RepID=A0ABW2KV27_9PROT
MFLNRDEAGRRLAERLTERLRAEPPADPVVLALPRGGLPVAAPVAAALGAPLDFVNVRKIGAPQDPELGLGAVVGGGGERPVTVLDERLIRLLRVAPGYLAAEERRQLAEIERRAAHYREGRPAIPIAGRTVIVVDDGIATGGTLRAALRALRRHGPARLIVAVPVAPPDVLAGLADAADGIVCLESPADFGAVGAHYVDFDQVSDAEAIAILRHAARRS